MASEDLNMNQDSASDKTPSPLLPNALNQENLSAAPPTAATASPTSGRRHRAYHGIRFRRGKWVSEIREPRKTTRIWLGTYPTQEMAAAAYDVAAMALKGPVAKINFPSLAPTYPLPASYSAADIRTAAASAAAAIAPRRAHPGGDQIQSLPPPENVNAASSSEPAAPPGHEFIDDEALFDMPKLLEEMAEGMLVSPPRMESAADHEESPENYSGDDSLWNYS